MSGRKSGPLIRLDRGGGKRCLDVALSVPLLLVLSAPMLLVALLVKLDSRGPVFFVQPRLGRGGRVFSVLKFRTMTARPRTRHVQVFDGDPEVTRVGRWLRRLKIDEWPQFWNIVRGEMSLVGPRPGLPEHKSTLDDRGRLRLEVRPGLTGLGLVTAFWRLHPLLPLELSHPRLELVEHGETVYVDLSLSPQDQWAEVRPRLRSQIRKLGREGFSVTWDDWSRYGEFIELYDTTMKHVGASSGYFFGLEYFRGLQSALGPHLHLGLVETADGQLACGALLTEIGGLVEYHLGGTAMAWRQAGPSRLLFDAARHHFAARGNHKLHLGGGLGGQRDSLFRFKAGFSKHRARFSTARLVLDIDTTARLDATWQEAHTMAAVDPKYFPGYRQIPRAA